MLQKPIFDAKFIQDWEPQFNSAVHGIGQYDELVATVMQEISGTGMVSQSTLRKIVLWKAKRAVNRIKWESFNSIYPPRFKLAFSSDVLPAYKMHILIWDLNKLARLPVDINIQNQITASITQKAHGIRIPMASTILHFVYPDDFPIVDIRVSDFLYFISKIGKGSSPDKNIPDYYAFRSILLAISKQYGYSLRTMDKAMFAYHKLVLQPAMNAKFKTMDGGNTFSLRLDDDPQIRRSIIDQLDC